jgi:hypothetical protein
VLGNSWVPRSAPLPDPLAVVHRASVAVAFLTFGLTDFREAYELASWLVWIKLLNLIALYLLRRIVMKRYYPASKLF